nr:hypothetical protein CTI12_AA613050 [Tanacetum cinerariifolium]
MEQKQVSCGSVLPPLTANLKYTWLDVAQNLKTKKRDNGDQFFYTIHDPLINYRCRSRELLRKRIRGYYHGWYILSKKKTCPVISSELGGYIHIRDKMAGNIIHSYHVKDRTVSLSSTPSPVVPTSHVLVWECRLEDDHGEDPCKVDAEQTENEIVVTGVVDR